MFDEELIFARYPELLSCRADMGKAGAALISAARQNKKILVCGNGGSAADSEHIVGELMKGFLLKRELDEQEKKAWRDAYGSDDENVLNSLQHGIRAISLPSQVGICSAFINDRNPKALYAQLAYTYAEKGDLLLCITTSGNSENTLLAAKAAKLKGALVLGLTGERESRLSAVADICIKAPASETYRVQEYHLPIYHWLCAVAEKALFEG